MEKQHTQVIRIYSENANFQILNALKTNREKRNKLGFMVEGVRNINNALQYGWKINAFIYSPEKKLSDWAKNILSGSKAEIHYELSATCLAALSNKDEPSELLGIAQIPKDDLSRIPKKENPLIVLFDRPSSRGNLGTLIRSCDALGVDGLIVTGHAVDVYDPETVSATTGSLFSLPVVRIAAHEELTSWLKEMKGDYPDLQIVGTDEKGEVSIHVCDFTKPIILLAGNETHGLSAAFKAQADVMTFIPMQGGSASSLNVAVATSIIIAEALRQRRG